MEQYYCENHDYLMHHGIKGMKWGVRRYQNKDGSLTPAEKKKISKMYKSEANKVTDELNKQSTQMYIKAHNQAADKMNNGGIDKFNKEQEKKYGKDYAKRSEYEDDYFNMFDKEFTKMQNKLVYEFYKSNDNYKKAQSLVQKYDMTKWDDLARKNDEAIRSLREALEKER